MPANIILMLGNATLFSDLKFHVSDVRDVTLWVVMCLLHFHFSIFLTLITEIMLCVCFHLCSQWCCRG